MSPVPTPAWTASSPEFSLPPGEIHVWRAALDLPAPELAECRRLLSPEERARAERLLRAEDRLCFAAARGLLRRLLGWYLGAPPERLNFRYEKRGKPSVAGEFGRPVPRFNLSHSAGLALFAFASDRELGVDVEQLRDDAKVLAIARRYFDPGEAARVAALPEAEGRREFFRLWTRKEAWLKATGEGISGMERRVEQDVRYRVVSLDAGPEYQAALAHEGPEARLRLFQWV